MLSLIRTVYAPKVLKLYQASKAKEAAEREAQRLAREKAKAQSATPVRPRNQTTRGRSQKVVGYGASFATANDERTIRSLLLLKKYVDENKQFVHGKEIFISSNEVTRLQEIDPDFSVEYAFQSFFDLFNKYADGRISKRGGGRLFSAIHSSADSVGDMPPNTPTMNIELDRDIFEPSYFEDLFRRDGGHILDVNDRFLRVFFETPYAEFQSLMTTEYIDRSTFNTSGVVRLDSVNQSTITLLKAIKLFGRLSGNEDAESFHLDIDAMLESEFRDTPFSSENIDLQNLHGTFSTPRLESLLKLIYSMSIRYERNSETYSGLSHLTFRMPKVFFDWLKSTDFKEIETVFTTENFNGSVELPHTLSHDLVTRD